MKKIITSDSLKYYWNKNVSELVNMENIKLEEGRKERHKLYSLLLMSIIYYYWNGLKEGRNGTYPLNPLNVDPKESPYTQNDYLGHNIAAIAVDRFGSVIDFDFNHNKIFSSSAEHAEMRAVKRIYSLSQINDSWEMGTNPKREYLEFSSVSLYTSLESCAQCSGVMTLANVKEVIYLQSDPGQYLIGNIMRNLSKQGAKYFAPRPISGQDFQFEYFKNLNDAYVDFYNETPVIFIDENMRERKSRSITSFLCTETAYRVYEEAKKEFERLTALTQKLKYPEYKPNGLDEDNKMKTNEDVLEEVKDFYQYAVRNGRRGTAH
ncbi:hypothetical protein QUF95_07040 [Paenibacillus silvae]|uniref:hypothetical protein n=1 Tax=Paenibacillus silvae TaxID=1325358 RepID=UPI00259FE82B|nr:hypothetical protein [Paenibacillus silvae]MDM5277131.1 hypothetical protein [Paenibacillus silvae]